MNTHNSVMRSRYLTCNNREMHFTEWGQVHNETVICWHGLARTGRDFDALASRLSEHYRVICPDTLGRGLSQWALNPLDEYCLDFYGSMVIDLCNQLGIKQLRWVGTSMGGLLGIKLAAHALNTRITHLIINDIGPEVPEAAAQRIATYSGQPPEFETLTALESWLKTVYAPFGPQTDATWRDMAETSWRRTDKGTITVHYDPRMVSSLTRHPDDLALWPSYDRIQCKTLLVRGALSDVLTPETAQMMTKRGPACGYIEIAGCGHAPMLNNEAQQRVVTAFLSEDYR